MSHFIKRIFSYLRPPYVAKGTDWFPLFSHEMMTGYLAERSSKITSTRRL